MRFGRSVALGATFLIGCAVGGASSQLFVPPIRAGTNPQRWEYHCLFGEAGITEMSNKLGEQGWEMAAAAGAGAGAGLGQQMRFTWCFKRPRL